MKHTDTREHYTEKTETIFISIASYRDEDCLQTVKDALKKAKYPSRLYFGICQQNKLDTESCVPSNLPPSFRKNIKVMTVPHTEAKGPCVARYHCSKMYDNQTYFMQIDSHTVFVPHWDEISIQNLLSCPNPLKSVISYYPHDSKSNDINVTSIPILCKSNFNNDGMVYFQASTQKAGKTPRPIPFLAGGYMFAYGGLLKDVPYDPSLEMVFTGEELLYSARAWTHGYDFYAPLKNVVFHYYTRKSAPKFWNDIKDYKPIQKRNLYRVKKLLGFIDGQTQQSYAYPMGTERTVQQYLDFAGIDPTTKTTTTEDLFC